MQRIKNLNGYQKGLLLLMLAMALVFAVVYHMTIARVGVLYQNAILFPLRKTALRSIPANSGESKRSLPYRQIKP